MYATYSGQGRTGKHKTGRVHLEAAWINKCRTPKARIGVWLVRAVPCASTGGRTAHWKDKCEGRTRLGVAGNGDRTVILLDQIAG